MGEIRKENLHQSLIDYLDGLGLTEEQVQGLIENALVEINEKNVEQDEVVNGLVDKVGELNGLMTEEKGDLVGAINELFQNANNGKELIASAIGEPLDSNDTFSAMSNNINSLLSTFKTNMMNNGVTVNSGDRFKQLIDKIATMVEEGSGKGVQFAEGTFNITIVNNYNYDIVIDINLDFNPTLLFLTCGPNVICSNIHNSQNNMPYFGGDTSAVYIYSFDSSSIILRGMTYRDAYNVSRTGTWYAIGVGEEDTTLRDSLASIIQEEGVSVTEEDDMSSLITKVDIEFNDKNNEINGLNSTITNKNNEINDMKQDLTNALVNKGLNVNTGSSFDELIGSIGNINNYIAKAGSTYKIINIANHTAGRLLMDTYLELTNVLLIVPGTYTVSFELYTGSYDEIGGSTNSSPGYCRVQHVRGGTVVSTVDEYSTKYPGETFNININNVKTGDQIYIYGKTANTSRFYNVRNIIISCSL
jgi:hypothetical protein